MTTRVLQLPESTRLQLCRFRKRLRRIRLAEGALAGAACVLWSFLIVFASDRFFDTPGGVRTAVLLTGFLIPAALLVSLWYRWIWNTRRFEHVAPLLRRQFPALADQLLGVIELTQQSQQDSSLRLAQAAVSHVDRLIQQTDLMLAVPASGFGLRLSIASVPLCLIVLLAVLVQPACVNAFQRWMMPWHSIPRYTFTQIFPLPGDMVVPRGEAFPVTARLKPQSLWFPSHASPSVSHRTLPEVSRNNDRYELVLPPQADRGQLRLQIGDFQDSVNLNVVDRPALATIDAKISLPDYLQRTESSVADVRGGSVTVVRGSTITLSGNVSRDLSRMTMNDDLIHSEGTHFASSGIQVDGPETVELQWQDILGLEPVEGFPVRLRALDDSEPQIVFHQLQPRQVVLSTDVVLFEIQADDDFGLRHAGIQWQEFSSVSDPQSVNTGEKLVARGSPSQEQLNITAAFCAESDHVKPQLLQLRAFTEDYLPERGRVYSAPVVLQVMSPDEHAVWVAEQMRRWAGLADDVYEQEMRLHTSNRELRQLSSELLDKPETRQRIVQQATAEQANAALLSSVTDQGELLIEQAMINREMLADHLEGFAASLQKLRDISDQRMPSVSDLLNQASRAPGQASSGEQAQQNSELTVGNHHGSAFGKPQEPKAGQPENAIPQITEVESGFVSPSTEQQPTAELPPSAKARLSLPVTMIPGANKPAKKQEADDSTSEMMDAAVEDQATLLLEFQSVRDQLQAISDDLENSTFVKRLKSASRKQLEIADELNRTLQRSFGQDSREFDDRQKQQTEAIAVHEDIQSRRVTDIRSDLEAWCSRRSDAHLRQVLSAMQAAEPAEQLNEIAVRVRSNLSGEAISRAEFWSDTLDRWAEELVPESPEGKSQKKNGKSSSLPPAVILEVMRMLHDEMNLREETRSVEASRSAVTSDEFRKSARRLEQLQAALFGRTRTVLKQIRELPEGDDLFSREIASIELAGMAMLDATTVLSRPDTGSEAVAAETEAIEQLLQSRRNNAKGGGAGKASSPGQGDEGTTDRPAIAQFGPSSDRTARIDERSVLQSTGNAAETLPEEFRDGLDVFFNAVENRR
jgi:adenylate kinase family enzyme